MTNQVEKITPFAEMQSRLAEMYKEDQRSQTFNCILTGATGSGKTHSIRTLRRPILVHSFDPGGVKTLRKDPGFLKDLIVDTRFEQEDPKTPTAWDAWEKEYQKLKRDNIFEQLGTYVIDSATTFAEVLMNAVLKKAGRANGTPQQMDWMVQMNTLQSAIKDFVGLPCDCLLTSHLDFTKDEVTGRLMATPMLTGKLKQKILLLFDEIYVAMAKETARGTEYSFLTSPTSIYTARTRLGTGGTFEHFEKPDFKHLLKKAGLPSEDKKGG